jgi:hypothetical protein
MNITLAIFEYFPCTEFIVGSGLLFGWFVFCGWVIKSAINY